MPPISIYNWTSLFYLQWHTPYKVLHSKQPQVNHLCVFGCTAYIFLPSNVWADKLAHKSELMVYLGVAPGNDVNFLSMHSPNNVLFTTVHTSFEEAQFSKCDRPKRSTGVPTDIPAEPPIKAPISHFKDSPPLSCPSSPDSHPVMLLMVPTPVRQLPAPRKQHPPPPPAVPSLLTIPAKSTASGKFKWNDNFIYSFIYLTKPCTVYIHHAWNKIKHCLCSYQNITVLFQSYGRTFAKDVYIVHYLSSSKDLCIQYSATGNQNGLCAYSDTDWTRDIETLHSTTGYAIFLGNGIVSWLSRWQWSSTEAKYSGITAIAKQLHWIHNIYEKSGFKLDPLLLCIDNQGPMFLASNPAQEGQTKHICIPEHYIHEAVELEEIKLYYVPTNLQFADIFTKNLGKPKFQEGRKALWLSRFKTS